MYINDDETLGFFAHYEISMILTHFEQPELMTDTIFLKLKEKIAEFFHNGVSFASDQIVWNGGEIDKDMLWNETVQIKSQIFQLSRQNKLNKFLTDEDFYAICVSSFIKGMTWFMEFNECPNES